MPIARGHLTIVFVFDDRTGCVIDYDLSMSIVRGVVDADVWNRAMLDWTAFLRLRRSPSIVPCTSAPNLNFPPISGYGYWTILDKSSDPHPTRQEAPARGRRAAHDAACVDFVFVCYFHGFVRTTSLFFLFSFLRMFLLFLLFLRAWRTQEQRARTQEQGALLVSK